MVFRETFLRNRACRRTIVVVLLALSGCSATNSESAPVTYDSPEVTYVKPTDTTLSEKIDQTSTVSASDDLVATILDSNQSAKDIEITEFTTGNQVVLWDQYTVDTDELEGCTAYAVNSSEAAPSEYSKLGSEPYCRDPNLFREMTAVEEASKTYPGIHNIDLSLVSGSLYKLTFGTIDEKTSQIKHCVAPASGTSDLNADIVSRPICSR